MAASAEEQIPNFDQPGQDLVNVFEQCDVSSHPILKEFIGKVDNSLLLKLANYDCFWNWISHRDLDEKKLNRISKQLESDSEGDSSSEEDGDEELKEERTKENTDNLETPRIKSNSEGTSQGIPSPEEEFDNDNNSARIIAIARTINQLSEDVYDLVKQSGKEAFWLTYLGRLEPADEIISNLFDNLKETRIKIRSLGDKCSESERKELPVTKYFLLNPSVSDGYLYILHGLNLFWLLKSGKYDKCTEINQKFRPSDLSELPKKSQIIIKSVKLNFFGTSRQYFPQILETVEEV